MSVGEIFIYFYIAFIKDRTPTLKGLKYLRGLMPSFASMQMGNGPEICQLTSLCDISCHMETLHLDVKKSKQCTMTIFDTSQSTMPLPLLTKRRINSKF